MDFKTELQNLVNKYAGVVKKVKVEFVKDIEVSPNGEAPISYASTLPTYMPPPVSSMGAAGVPAVSMGTGFMEGSVTSTGTTPAGLPMKKPQTMPPEFAMAQGSATGAVLAAVAAAKARAEKKVAKE